MATFIQLCSDYALGDLFVDPWEPGADASRILLASVSPYLLDGKLSKRDSK